MAVIRTPEERFANLPDFPFAPNYVEVGGLRMHYVDEGEGNPVLMLHGEPSWSYLYRKIIAGVALERRAVAPDFVGFGRSDKFTEMDEYTYKMHLDSLLGFIESLELNNITMMVQDWGGLVGLRAATLVPERVSRLVIMNTGLPTGEENMPEAFFKWQEFVRNTDDLPIGMIIQGGTVKGKNMDPDVVAAYEAPFPGPEYKAGAKKWPLMVPTKPDDPVAPEMRAAREVLSKWDKPVMVMFSDKDPITKGADRLFRELIPGAGKQPEVTIKDAGHFLQEDRGEEIASRVLEFISRTE